MAGRMLQTGLGSVASCASERAVEGDDGEKEDGEGGGGTVSTAKCCLEGLDLTTGSQHF